MLIHATHMRTCVLHTRLVCCAVPCCMICMLAETYKVRSNRLHAWSVLAMPYLHALCSCWVGSSCCSSSCCHHLLLSSSQAGPQLTHLRHLAVTREWIAQQTADTVTALLRYYLPHYSQLTTAKMAFSAAARACNCPHPNTTAAHSNPERLQDSMHGGM